MSTVGKYLAGEFSVPRTVQYMLPMCSLNIDVNSMTSVDRRYAWDGNLYTEQEFADWYGTNYEPCWDEAEPSLTAAKCAAIYQLFGLLVVLPCMWERLCLLGCRGERETSFGNV